ncbi:MAG: hypothetical protein ACM33T_13390 [Solirubrobacterales bacterium]
MTVVPFPTSSSAETRLQGIASCLDYLVAEAEAMGLDLLAHVIGVAREEAREEAAKAAGE